MNDGTFVPADIVEIIRQHTLGNVQGLKALSEAEARARKGDPPER